MWAGSTRRFDLYDFFSVFLPGTALVLGLLPFLPNNVEISTTGVLLPVAVLGYVGGRGLHSLANSIDSLMGNDTHRQLFVHELQTEKYVFTNPHVVDRFYSEVRSLFGEDLGLPDDRTDLDYGQGSALYTLIRSYIHIDSRGRSRTFQAVYSFYRSIWLASFILSGFYIAYGSIRLAGLTERAVDYYTHVSALGIPSLYIILFSMSVASGAYTTFRGAKGTYQEYFVQYLVSDFLVLRDSETALEPGDPATPQQQQGQGAIGESGNESS